MGLLRVLGLERGSSVFYGGITILQNVPTIKQGIRKTGNLEISQLGN
jgi:hypothetical protein